MFERWLESPAAAALGWTLVHSAWEGAAIALALGCASRAMRSARTRYYACCIALVALLFAFGATFARRLPAASGERPGAIKIPVLSAAPDSAGAARFPVPRTAEDFLPWLTPVWIAGVLLFHLRGAWSWMAASRMRRGGVCGVSEQWQRRLDNLAARSGLARAVTLLESSLADTPVLSGYLRPTILLPVGLLTGLPVEQIEAILLHELAHVRRHDYLVNLLQMAAESFLFYHPAVWWISREIRVERENCCDDMVVAALGEPYVYATALTALEQRRGRGRAAAMAASGGSLVQRVRRLLHPARPPRATAVPVLSASVLALAMVAGVAAWQAPAPTPSAKPDPYVAWLNEDVAYIVTDAERAAFRALTTDEERDHFIEQFWLRRDPTPGTPENEFRIEHYRRIAFANTHFAAQNVAGWKADRGRIYITFGPPDEIDAHPSPTAPDPPYEQWRYRAIEGVGRDVVMDFVDANRDGEYRMTVDPAGGRGGRRVELSPR